LLFLVGLLSISCNGQNKETKNGEPEKKEAHLNSRPKGSWKVDREFDESGNLIRYDSIYSWSSNNHFKNLLPSERDSLMRSFQSRFFTNFSRFKDQGFEDVFAEDSLFSRHFFNEDFFRSDFGQDFMDIDRIRQQMQERQRMFLKKYQSEFKEPKEED